MGSSRSCRTSGRSWRSGSSRAWWRSRARTTVPAIPSGPARPSIVSCSGFARGFGNGQGYAAGRSALFLKGTVLNDYLLTLSFDSDKDDRGVLFRDIQPEAFYPIYGDASLKGFDAQTSGRLYLRAERGRSHLLYGDFRTADVVSEAQDLGRYSRDADRSPAAPGHRPDHAVGVCQPRLALAGDRRDRGPRHLGPLQREQCQRRLGHREGRDRDPRPEPAGRRPHGHAAGALHRLRVRALQRTPAVPAAGAGLDERLNPVSIRITYEVDHGGEKSWVGGLDGQLALGRVLRVGGSWAEDRAPASPYRLTSVNGTLRIGRSTVIVAEGAQSTGVAGQGLFGQPGLITLDRADAADAGSAARLELRHESARFGARLFAGTADAGFSNPGSTLAAGRTEMGGQATLTVAAPVRVMAEAIRSEDALTGGHREGAFLALEAKLAKALAVEVGLRRGKESGIPAQGTSAGLSVFGQSGFERQRLRLRRRPEHRPRHGAARRQSDVRSAAVVRIRADRHPRRYRRADGTGQGHDLLRRSRARVRRGRTGRARRRQEAGGRGRAGPAHREDARLSPPRVPVESRQRLRPEQPAAQLQHRVRRLVDRDAELGCLRASTGCETPSPAARRRRPSVCATCGRWPRA